MSLLEITIQIPIDYKKHSIPYLVKSKTHLAMAKETIQEAIGKFINRERTKQKLSLTALSIKVYKNKCSATRIGNIEKGRTRDSSINTISDILSALGYDLREIFQE